MREKFDNVDYLIGSQADNLNIEADKIESVPVDQVVPAVPTADISKDAADVNREEKIELLMKNVKEFIRNIDVKAL